MITLRGISALKDFRKSISPECKIGFVPTMGALHEGHMSLVDLARASNDLVVVSIFVNPLQFGPNEDLTKYPRTLEADLGLLKQVGCDAVFLPSVDEMYPDGASTTVVEHLVSKPLCGEFRPGHFRGVATVVLKLLNLVRPDSAYFGQKDAQQCAVIERMVKDLNLDVQILRGPTIREEDGLALSSRNRYLNEEQRALAPQIYQSMLAAIEEIVKGERNVARLVQVGRSLLESSGAFKIQYWEIRNAATLEPLEELDQPPRDSLMSVAAYLGETRLIDNLMIPAQLLGRTLTVESVESDQMGQMPSPPAFTATPEWQKAELPAGAPPPPTGSN